MRARGDGSPTVAARSRRRASTARRRGGPSGPTAPSPPTRRRAWDRPARLRRRGRCARDRNGPPARSTAASSIPIDLAVDRTSPLPMRASPFMSDHGGGTRSTRRRGHGCGRRPGRSVRRGDAGEVPVGRRPRPTVQLGCDHPAGLAVCRLTRRFGVGGSTTSAGDRAVSTRRRRDPPSSATGSWSASVLTRRRLGAQRAGEWVGHPRPRGSHGASPRARDRVDRRRDDRLGAGRR